MKLTTFIFCISVLSISCNKESSNLDNCDAYAIQKMESEGYVKIKGREDSPNNYSDLSKGYYKQQVVYVQNGYCGLACEVVPRFFNCDGAQVDVDASAIKTIQPLGYFVYQP
ncbi:hypothetical protein [Niabella ginsengisoli]|uniref:Lipoprotein n=1 Tax=Niabella ginsengisoli TaxID=522298 RepID=A0ABS9SPW9_9BACT|nr:hypothetical protein [Niabella ginsengisoli]MCH5600402.1 hypothetical protein [Niabella ginsengisoli]